ncbi:Secretory immunoglobulin A-binding protein EsiB [Sporomusa rhizae]|uniref:tetratricopeptide repeat protein n=1 Tax=Sporomusa rhizae TaxID=357999 RepID=UPI00352A4569
MKKITLCLIGMILIGVSIVYAEVPADLLVKAEHEDAKAQLEVAKMYREGINTPIDHMQATKWFVKAKVNFEKQAMSGNAEAQFTLSQMYERGYGTPPDESKRIYWLEKAAENGYPAAQSDIAFKYSIEIIDDYYDFCLGRGNHFGKGQVLGDDSRSTALKKLYWFESQLFKKAVYWNERAAETGNVPAQYWLGQTYADVGSEGKPIDYNKARYWWEQAAANGDLLAPLDLGIMYFYGEGSPVDYEKAEYWLKKVEARKNELGNSDKKNLEKMLSKIRQVKK